MKFFVLGATGTTGALFLEQALAAGHAVTAYVRAAGKLTARDGLTVVTGDVLDSDAMATAMREAGADAVVSMLGLRSAAPRGFSEDAVRTIAAAAERAGITRVLILSAFGVGDSIAKASWVARAMYKSGAKAIYADKAAGEAVLTASTLDWTLAYPVLLTNGPQSSNYEAIDLADVTTLPGLPRVSRADVAEFLITAAQDDSWSRRTAVLTRAR